MTDTPSLATEIPKHIAELRRLETEQAENVVKLAQLKDQMQLIEDRLILEGLQGTNERLRSADLSHKCRANHEWVALREEVIHIEAQLTLSKPRIDAGRRLIQFEVVLLARDRDLP